MYNHLLNGDKKAACQAAIDACYWEHGLIIASSIGRDWFFKVFTAFSAAQFGHHGFAGENIDLSPLHVLYSQFSGGTPAAALASLGQDFDWQLIVCFLLSNRTTGDQGVLEQISQELLVHNHTLDAHIWYVVSNH